jgi:hypothetical protein
VDQSFFEEGLKGAVYRDPVESLPGFLLDIAMGECAVLLEKKLQYPAPATGDAQLIFFQEFINLFFHVSPGCC